HLDLIIDQQNLARFQHRRELLEIARWRNYVAAGALNRLDKEGGELRLLRLAVPDRVIFAVEQASELIDAVEAAIVALLSIRAAEAIGKRHEVRPVTEVPVAPAIAIGRGDGRGAEGTAMIAALERKHEALAAGGV